MKINNTTFNEAKQGRVSNELREKSQFATFHIVSHKGTKNTKVSIVVVIDHKLFIRDQSRKFADNFKVDFRNPLISFVF
jgi:hypothetical protein